MLEDSTADLDTVLQALAEQIRQVDGGVDADGGELDAVVGVLWQLVLLENSEIWNDSVVPWRFGDKPTEESCPIGAGVLLTVEDQSIRKTH